MDRAEYIQNGLAKIILQSFPQSLPTDVVTIDIYNASTGAVDTASTAMTYVSGTTWKYAWTPGSVATFIATFYDATLDVRDYAYFSSVGSITGVPSPAGLGSTLTTLIAKFLKTIDNYNANDIDPTVVNSSGELAKISINYGLQKIYAQIKDSKYMRAYPTTALISTPSQSYIDLGAVSDLDEIETIQDQTNNITLLSFSAWKYFFEIPNPSRSTGTPFRYARVFNRIYLDPQPTATITYNCFYIKNFADLSGGTDQALIPSKYDEWIIEEARVKWLMMEDITNSQAIEEAKAERDDCRAFYLADVMSQFDKVSQTQSHWTRKTNRQYIYKRPI